MTALLSLIGAVVIIVILYLGASSAINYLVQKQKENNS